MSQLNKISKCVWWPNLEVVYLSMKTFTSNKNGKTRLYKIAQWIMALALKTENLSLALRIYMVGRKDQLPKVFF